MQIIEMIHNMDNGPKINLIEFLKNIWRYLK